MRQPKNVMTCLKGNSGLLKFNQINRSVIARQFAGSLKITVPNLITVTAASGNLRFSLNIPVNHIHTCILAYTINYVFYLHYSWFFIDKTRLI